MRQSHAFFRIARVLTSLSCVLAAASALRASDGQAPAGAIDESNLVTLHGNTHPLARPEFDRGPVDEEMALKEMTLVLRASPQQEAALAKLMAEQQDRASPNYHRWLTPEEFGARFGPSVATIRQVTAWLESHGFQIEHVANGRRQITFSGTAGQVRAAFHTSIHKFNVNGERHYANASDPRIPAALAPTVAGVAALHDFRAQPQYHRMPAAKPSGGKPSSNFTFACGGSTCFGVGPADFGTIYNVSPLWNNSIDGTGQTIAIVQRTNINLSDVSDFRSLFGLPAKTPQVVITNTDPGINADETEALLDVEWSGAVAPNATIKMVTSTSGATDGVMLSAQYIVDHVTAPVVSMSYGLCELGQGAAGNQQISDLWQQAAAQGQTVFISTGDSGSAGCDNPNGTTPAQFGLAVNGLASTPYNIAVGGTDFNDPLNPDVYWSPTNDPTTKASALSYIPEIPWNSTCSNNQIFQFGFSKNGLANCNDSQLVGAGLYVPVGGSGGRSNCIDGDGSSLASCHQGYAKPSWQAGPGVPADRVRDLPDISLFASSGFFGASYVICEADQQGGPCDASHFLGIGGTSASAPAAAGIMALVVQSTGEAQGNANYVFYKLAAAQSAASCNSSKGSGSACVFNDVTTGTNAMPCFAGSLNCSGTGAFGIGIQTGFNTTSGYDLASGLGTINAANLVAAWPADSIQ
ncbi:MAG TPA: S53 family peptidase, partial [Candidatus Sulfotelmatobacter sp.]|nr:S53 family peptidase [Candidatus Sulfotelmatobacter sp.]